MAIPDYQTIMLPLLKFAGDGKEHSLRDAVDYLAGEFQLNEWGQSLNCEIIFKN